MVRLRPGNLSGLALLLTIAAGVLPWIDAVPALRLLHRLNDTELVALGKDMSTWLLQLAAAAGLIVGAAAFLAVQAAGGLVATRRLRTVLRNSSAAVSCWFTLMLVAAEAVTLRVVAVTTAHDQVARLIGWSFLALAAVFVAVGAIFLEQVHFADVYRLAPEFSRGISAAAIRRFGFVAGPLRSLSIQRYNLDFCGTDPIGPLGEVFEHAVQAHDRVLLQSICDAMGGRVAAAARVPFRTERLREIAAQRLTTVARASRRRARRTDDAAVVGLYVVHFWVRNAANLRRKWRTAAGRHPFLLSALRTLRSIAPYPELAASTVLVAEGLAAMVLAARAEQRCATVEPYEVVALVAFDLWHLGHREAAALLWQAYLVCHATGNAPLFPIPSAVPPAELNNLARVVEQRLARDPTWVPGARSSLWIGMLAELDARTR